MIASTGTAAAARLRLGVDFHTFDGIYQGSRSHLIGLYREAIVRAPDIDFVFFLAQPNVLRAAYPEFARVNVALVEMPHRPGIWRLLWQLPSLQRRHRLDLLHVQYRLPWVAVGPCICTLHDVLFESHPQFFSKMFVRMARHSARRAVDRALIIFTVSTYSANQIVRYYGVDAERVVVTPNAVDRQRFFPRDGNEPSLEAWGLRPGEYLCTLGRIEPRKNHSALLHAYAQLPGDVPPLIIIGQRDFAHAEVFELIERLRLRLKVRILEGVDDAALPLLLRHAKLMVYPSHAEGFGMPVLEALASGVPVITSDTTSLPEIAGPSAWLVSPQNIDGLARAMLLALTEPPAERRARIEQGLLHAAKFNWHVSAATLLEAVRNAAL